MGYGDLKRPFKGLPRDCANFHNGDYFLRELLKIKISNNSNKVKSASKTYKINQSGWIFFDQRDVGETSRRQRQFYIFLRRVWLYYKNIILTYLLGALFLLSSDDSELELELWSGFLLKIFLRIFENFDAILRFYCFFLRFRIWSLCNSSSKIND